MLRFELQWKRDRRVSLRELYSRAFNRYAYEKNQLLRQDVAVHSRSLVNAPERVELTRSWCAVHSKHVVAMAPGNSGFDVAVPFGEDCVALIDTSYTARSAAQPASTTDGSISAIDSAHLKRHVNSLWRSIKSLHKTHGLLPFDISVLFV